MSSRDGYWESDEKGRAAIGIKEPAEISGLRDYGW
jgi:hypothetical protein